jgi:hypothetical protein
MRACQEVPRLSLNILIYAPLLLVVVVTCTSPSPIIGRIGISTDRTSDWCVGCYSRPMFRLTLWPSGGRFIQLWLKPTVPDTQTCSCLCLFVSTWGTNIRDPLHVEILLQNLLTCTVWDADSLENFLHIFISATSKRAFWFLTTLQPKFHYIWLEKKTCSPWHYSRKLVGGFHVFTMQCP